MVLQAYIDESFEPNGVFVLGGYLATPDAWAAFSREWEALLPTALRGADGRHYFKMSSMARPGHIARVSPFFRVIEKHVLGWVSVKIDQGELKSAIRRIHVPRAIIDWEKYANPWFIAFRFLMDHFHTHRPLMRGAIPTDVKVDFYFDERVEKRTVQRMWENYMRNRPDDFKKFYGAAPQFGDDNDFLPLQAADLWVWHVRKWWVEATPEKVKSCAFDGFGLSGGKKFLRFDVTVNEEQLIQTLVKVARGQLTPEKPIYVLPAGASLSFSRFPQAARNPFSQLGTS